MLTAHLSVPDSVGDKDWVENRTSLCSQGPHCLLGEGRQSHRQSRWIVSDTWLGQSKHSERHLTQSGWSGKAPWRRGCISQDPEGWWWDQYDFLHTTKKEVDKSFSVDEYIVNTVINILLSVLWTSRRKSWCRRQTSSTLPWLFIWKQEVEL